MGSPSKVERIPKADHPFTLRVARLRGHTRSSDPNRGLHVTPLSDLTSRGAARMGPLPLSDESNRSISTQACRLTFINNYCCCIKLVHRSIAGRPSLLPWLWATHGMDIYIYAVRVGLPAAALACVAAGLAQACGVLRVAWRCADVPRCVQLQRLASALSFGAGQVGIRRLCVLRCARPLRVGSFAC